MNVLSESVDYSSSGKLSLFIMIFSINHKTATMTAHQFNKQALILLTPKVVYKYCNSVNLLTDDRNITGS